MRILSLSEQAAWMARRGLPANPYQCDGEKFEFYLQFYAPKSLRSTECFTEGVLNFGGSGDEIMMTVVDTENPYDYEERLFNRLRFPASEPKAILESPAHLFDRDELGDVIPMFSLTVGWQWESYLHIPGSGTVLLNWEGDIFDVWTHEQSVFLGISDMLKAFGLEPVEQDHS